jgi:hypothetical protein
VKKAAKDRSDEIAPEDAALFRAAVGTVKPLPEQNRITPRPAPRKPLLDRPATPVAISDTLSDFAAENVPDEFLSNGLSRMTLRKLRRGTWPIQDSLDLHGNNTDAARKLLQAFLHEATERNLRCAGDTRQGTEQPGRGSGIAQAHAPLAHSTSAGIGILRRSTPEWRQRRGTGVTEKQYLAVF